MTSLLATKESVTYAFNKDKYSDQYGFKSCDIELPYHEYDVEEGERLLIILAYVTEEDAKTRKLGNSSQGLLAKKLIETTNNEIVEGIRGDLPKIKSVSLINFRDKKDERLMDADMDITSEMHKLWVDRLNDYIEAYKPTRILISSEQPYKAILYHTQSQLKNFNNLEAVEYKEPWLQVGRVFDFQYRGVTIPTTFTLPLHWTSTSNPRYIEEAPNLIHQQKFHLEYLLYGKNLYTVTEGHNWIRKDIMTLEAFDAFYEELYNAPKVCIDLETDNLSRFANKILTMHFSFDGQVAYNLPMCHKDTPFSGSEIQYIQSKFKAYFEDGKIAEHIFHNAKFDIGVMTAQLNLQFYNHKVYDTIAGIYSLDENVRYYTAIQAPAYGLRRVAYQYGCSAYDEGEIGKEDRSRMAELPLEHIFEYASKDVVIPFQVREFQSLEAKRRGYALWDEFVVEQLGAMVLVFVGMENKGILVDKNYLIGLCSEDGIVSKLLAEVLEKFKQSSSAKEVNEILVIQDRVINAFKKYKRIFRKDRSTLGKLIKVLEKPVRILKKQQSDEEFVKNVLHKQDKDQGDAKTLTPLLTSYENLNTICKQLEEIFELSPKELRGYNDRISQYNLAQQLNAALSIYQSVNVAEKDELETSIKEALSELESLAKFRSIPIDLEKEWLFDIGKQASQQLLFFDVLRLKPVEIRKDGGGTTNVDFQNQYGDIEEVALLDKFTKYKKLLSTYITGMMKRLEDDADSRLDGKLRADYGYKDVLTGRSSSRNPNFQNIPARGDMAKIIKRQFVAGKGEIYIKNDYNAAEVRQWANIAQDAKLASTFRTGMVMRKELFLEKDVEKQEALKQRIKGEGDVHRLNYSFFFNKKPQDVSDEERTAVKAVIFGVMYGKSSFSLAEDLKCSEKAATALLEKLFTTYEAGGNWIEDTKNEVAKSLVARSPIGRVRHLASGLHQNDRVLSATTRKVCNSITQGFSSDMGYAGGRILQQLVYKMFQKHNCPLHLIENNTVHDSVEAVTKFEHLPISLYLVDQAFTTLVQHKYKKVFGLNWVIESEMDSEVGCSIGTTKKLDWAKLPQMVRDELKWSATETGYSYTEEEVSEILRKFDHNYAVMTKIKEYETRQYLNFVEENPTGVYIDCLLLHQEKLEKLRTNLLF